MNAEENAHRGRTTKRRRGSLRKFFGCVLVFTGLLNTLLLLKAGLAAEGLDYALIVLGMALLASGLLGGMNRVPKAGA